MAIEPSFVAEVDEREPRKLPIGVRETPTMQTSIQKRQRDHIPHSNTKNKKEMKVHSNFQR